MFSCVDGKYLKNPMMRVLCTSLVLSFYFLTGPAGIPLPYRQIKTIDATINACPIDPEQPLYTTRLSRSFQNSQAMMIPAYFQPGSLWNQAISGTPTVTVLVMNPNNGPGLSASPAYLATVNNSQNNGIQVMGYVHTNYGRRDLQKVLDEISIYMHWYSVDGIFLDETSADPIHINYYQILAKHIRSFLNKQVILNPGRFPDKIYLTLSDILVVFEGTYQSYKHLVVPSWTYLHSADQFAHIVYDASTKEQMKKALRWSRERNAGLIFVTNDKLPNPCDTLPTYWLAELEEITTRRP